MSRELLSKLVITDIVSISTLYNNAGSAKSRANRSLWAIIIKYEGETVYTCKGKDYLSNLNNIIILPKGCSYNWKCTKSGHYSVIEFDSPATYDGILSFNVQSGEKIYKTIQKLERDKILKKELVSLECIKEAYEIIITLLQSAPHKYRPSVKQQKIAPALDFIANNYTKKLGNDMLAGLCGISTVYFRKLFTEITEKTPSEYIQGVKIEKAKEMLKSDHGTISDIAMELGYQNIYDFSRSFKKLIGISPKQFKELEK